MLIKPADLVDEPLQLNVTIPEEIISYAPDIRQKGDLHVTGLAELLVEHRGPRDFVDDIRLRAHISGLFAQLCARCLDPVEESLACDFDLLYRPEAADAEAGEHAITEEETEIGYYEKSGLLLEDAVREQVLLTLPGRTLCRQDCQGLCPRCGAHRNITPCECAEKPVDPRMSVLADLAAGLKAKA